jgi:2-polyprenyl-6-methoxyphenol hydroxylase-like FAD-dependent oxidoreductase
MQDRTNTSPACVVHARTLEVLEPLGVTADLLAGVKVSIFRVVIAHSSPSTFRRFRVVPQYRVERFLLSHLKELGGSVDRPCELVHCKALASHVEAQVRSDGATARVRTDPTERAL